MRDRDRRGVEARRGNKGRNRAQARWLGDAERMRERKGKKKERKSQERDQ